MEMGYVCTLLIDVMKNGEDTCVRVCVRVCVCVCVCVWGGAGCIQTFPD